MYHFAGVGHNRLTVHKADGSAEQLAELHLIVQHQEHEIDAFGQNLPQLLQDVQTIAGIVQTFKGGAATAAQPHVAVNLAVITNLIQTFGDKLPVVLADVQKLLTMYQELTAPSSGTPGPVPSQN